MTEPPVVELGVDPAVPLLFFGIAAAAAVVAAVALAVRHRDPLPVAACVGALICTLNEPIFDILGKIVYADELATAFSAFDRDIPWALVIGYVPWVGLLPYLISRAMAAGWSRARLHWIAVAAVSSVWLVEAVNLWLSAWEYYGEPPLKYFGGVAAMAGMPLVGGLLLYVFAEPLRGWARVLAGVVTPTVALPMVFAATGWPLYVALYSDLPKIADYAAIALLIALIAAVVAATTWLAERWRESSGPLRRASQ